jgi:predicted RNA-binding protein with PUA-like domain
MAGRTRYWLLKTEPHSYSIDDLARDGSTTWDGVRNYQARNFMRDEMSVGDWALIYHSSADPPGVAGLARVSGAARADLTALDPKDRHYDPKATKENPIWVMVEVAFEEKFPRFVPLEELRGRADLHGMTLLKRGSRLSIQPVDKKHFEIVRRLGRKAR